MAAADRAIIAGRNIDPFQFLLVAVQARISRRARYLSFRSSLVVLPISSSPSLPDPSLSFSLVRIQIYSDAQHYACVMLRVGAFARERVRGDSRSVRFALLRIFVTFHLFFPSPLFDALRARIFFLPGEGVARRESRDCTLDVSAKRGESRFSNFYSSTHTARRLGNGALVIVTFHY